MKVNLNLDKTVATAPYKQLESAVSFCTHVVTRKSFHINQREKDINDRELNACSIDRFAIMVNGPYAVEKPADIELWLKEFDSALKRAERLTCFVCYDKVARVLKTQVECFADGQVTPYYRLVLSTDRNNNVLVN